jgi:hypothetical protein
MEFLGEYFLPRGFSVCGRIGRCFRIYSLLDPVMMHDANKQNYLQAKVVLELQMFQVTGKPPKSVENVAVTDYIFIHIISQEQDMIFFHVFACCI